MIDSSKKLTKCMRCGFWESDYGACTCPGMQKWYLCPVEAEEPENKKKFDEYIEWLSERDERGLENGRTEKK